MIGAGKTGNAAADDGNLLAGVRTRRMQFQAMFQAIVTNKLLNRVDADMIFDFVAVTTIFTRCRADPAHDGRKWIGIGNTAECVFLPGCVRRWFFNTAHNIQPATNILT